MLHFPGAALALVCLLLPFSACADGPTSADGSKSADAQPAAAAVDSAPLHPSSAPVIIFGFLGGYVHHDDSVHSTVQVARDLRKDYPSTFHIETFENHRVNDAHGLLMDLLGAARAGGISDEQKNSARIILYGHSWGASTAVALARTLQKEGIPVLLTIQVDSVTKPGQNDAIIPANVHLAANFYQDKGFVHGQQKIQAADPSRTQILGNFRMDYTDNPISCPKYPWYTRVFMRSHIEIECDQHVWQRVEDLIREQLPTSTAAAAGTGTP
jgi:hypothetical protein